MCLLSVCSLESNLFVVVFFFVFFSLFFFFLYFYIFLLWVIVSALGHTLTSHTSASLKSDLFVFVVVLHLSAVFFSSFVLNCLLFSVLLC